MKPPDKDSDDSLDGFLDSPIFRLNPASAPPESTTIDNRYVIEQELGHTAMSQVYLACDLRLPEQRVVIKILSEALFEDAAARQRFDNELKTLVQLNHQHVIIVTDRKELPDGRPYLVMPYIDGETLRSQIQPNTGMDLERVASILKQVGAALDYIHENDILHRDLKPENIMLKRGTDSVVLIDFGIAKFRESQLAPSQAEGVLPGTLPYMSPEQLNGQRITSASDIYSMGVVAYEMLTGRRPFNPESPRQLADLQREGLRLKPSHLRAELSVRTDRIITRALSLEPKARSKTAGEFADRLARALLDEPGPPITFPKWARLTSGFVVLALVAFGIYEYCKKVDEPRSFKYWLTVQKMHDGKESQPPYPSNGQETFDNGDKFRLNVSTPTAAYLYIFNQGPPDSSDTSFFMVYPDPTINGGSSNVGANQPFQSDWITFRGPAGDENFWFAWSVRPIPELESAKVEALKHPRGGLSGDSLVAVKEFLRTKQDEFKTTVFHYKGNQTAVARGKTDTLITLAQFKHR